MNNINWFVHDRSTKDMNININNKILELIRQEKQFNIKIYDIDNNFVFDHSLTEFVAISSYVKANVHFNETNFNRTIVLPFRKNQIINFFQVYLGDYSDPSIFADFIVVADYLIIDNGLYESICNNIHKYISNANIMILLHIELERELEESAYDNYIYKLYFDTFELYLSENIFKLIQMNEMAELYFTRIAMNKIFDIFRKYFMINRERILSDYKTIINLNKIYVFYYQNLDKLRDTLINLLLNSTVWKYIYPENIKVIVDILIDKNIISDRNEIMDLIENSPTNSKHSFKFRIRETPLNKSQSLQAHYDFYYDINIDGLNCLFLGEIEYNPRLEYVAINLNKNSILNNYFEYLHKNNVEKITYTLTYILYELNFKKTYDIIINVDTNNSYRYEKKTFTIGYKLKNNISVINVDILIDNIVIQKLKN